ncbi:proline dehydrogenase family protein [Geoalkalibacter halelectricus]|uniref:L-glutamate gamma-semialdehyde dehydrogenase n=1 Tax=Geoalkalibacter halelectricus TaxID=2847045 RepID=A0ABY5ZPU6_9BACT|nr:proline dehydrogenase family protein [Geoalkalibacter halelectricus]MDO3376883.1 proline dehydrogenase family protein [Geoalkalibacter halelectricus]UWZ81108.1 proline dehydrogenase family protein [Geoalkalibacter halelectricus]
MMNPDLNERIIARGHELFAAIADRKPSLFKRDHWAGKVLDWCMRQEDFKVRMFRFIDVFPSLKSGDSLQRHLQEYFGDLQDLPEFLRWGLRTTGVTGQVGGAVLRRFLARNIRQMARQFIIGETPGEALRHLGRLRQEGFAFTLDALGEATVSEEEAEQYVAGYLHLIQRLREIQEKWPALRPTLPGSGGDWGHAPKINLSVKPTALYSQARAQDFNGSVEAITARLERIYAQVREVGAFLCIDMESHASKDITLAAYRRLREQHPKYPHLGIVLQAYHRETEDNLDLLLTWARKKGLHLNIRLVKGAYWDLETVLADQNGWPQRVFTDKAATDANFEKLAYKILEHSDLCDLAVGSHNIRSIAAVLEMARALRVPEERYEFQVLYGMAEPVRQALREVAGRVRLYCPFGEMVPGMAYLVRRLLENTANESFLRQSFVEGEELDALLADPRELARRKAAQPRPTQPALGLLPPFRNEPSVDFTRPEQRAAFAQALSQVRSRLGASYPLFINGRELTTEKTRASVNPADPGETIGHVSQAGPDEIAQAVTAARDALPGWRATPVPDRAACLLRAAQVARGRIFELAAWQVVEIGKQWDQAYADVGEAIDFLEFYAREMLRLDKPHQPPSLPGEDNRLLYQSKGVAAVIAPWNFPLAISCGMTAAALVTGNTVIFKPSSLTPVIGWTLVELLGQAGLPPGVFNFVPGASREIGDLLVEHPEINVIAFTGSLEVGMRILEKSSKATPGGRHVKKVVAEMGGKNAIILDEDADLDEAIPAIIASAFAFQGQKCSACSRLIVVDALYPALRERLVRAVRSLRLGPADNPANFMGPVADREALHKIRAYMDLAAQEGQILYQGKPPAGAGYHVPITLVEGIRPEHRLANEEVFGPLLALMRAADFDQALRWANAPPQALTGGVFSRSPANLARARREFRVGNLYLNRGITGALVGRQPFGGFGLSGTGTKAGGGDYLLHFMDPRCVTENTLRRGFAPSAGENHANGG